MRIGIHVIPGSSKSSIEPGDPWRVHLHAKPVEGKANEELIELLCRHFGVSRSAIRITNGYTSRNKTVDVNLAGTPPTRTRS